MKIFVLGATGMLGKYVSKYLSENFDVIDVNRNILDASNMSEEKLDFIFSNQLKIKENDVIINCVGTIKPRVDELGDINAIVVNSIFPRILANVSNKFKAKLIHPTTDCVYTGLKGNYNENDKYDVGDVYGMTKALGEPNNCTVIRTSIIGEEVGQARSLVEWVKSNKNNTVFGFTNHMWNGVTCLQFAKIVETIIVKNLFWLGTKHVHSDKVSKKELVELISKIYELNISVTPKETEIKCDRTLSSIYEINDLLGVPTLNEQIIEMKKFHSILFN